MNFVLFYIFLKLVFSHSLALGWNCRSTENDFVKSSLPAKLQRIRTFGSMKLEAFKDLISEEAYDYCQKEKTRRTTWYSLTVDVFVSFLFKVIILHIVLLNIAHVYGRLFCILYRVFFIIDRERFPGLKTSLQRFTRRLLQKRSKPDMECGWLCIMRNRRPSRS